MEYRTGDIYDAVIFYLFDSCLDIHLLTLGIFIILFSYLYEYSSVASAVQLKGKIEILCLCVTARVHSQFDFSIEKLITPSELWLN